MNMNLNDEAARDVGAGSDDCKFEISGLKDDAVAVGDAAVTVISDERATSAEKTRANCPGETRRKVVRRSGVLQGRKRWGKIARIPVDVREWLNEQIRDSVTYVEIAAALKVKGFDGVTKFDLSSWRRGGHQEWLRDQERLAAIRNDVERVVKVVGQVSEDEAAGVERVNELLIGLQIVHALQDLHRGTLKSLVEKKPELMFRIARVASDQARDRARRKRVNLVVRKFEERQAERSVQLDPEVEPGLTPETLRLLEAAMAKL